MANTQKWFWWLPTEAFVPNLPTSIGDRPPAETDKLKTSAAMCHGVA